MGGSNSFASLKKPEILMLVGDGASSRGAGEIRPLFDQRYKIPVFKSGTSVAKPLDKKYAEPVKFAEEPYISGYVSKKILTGLKMRRWFPCRMWEAAN